MTHPGSSPAWVGFFVRASHAALFFTPCRTIACRIRRHITHTYPTSVRPPSAAEDWCLPLKAVLAIRGFHDNRGVRVRRRKVANGTRASTRFASQAGHVSRRRLRQRSWQPVGRVSPRRTRQRTLRPGSESRRVRLWLTRPTFASQEFALDEPSRPHRTFSREPTQSPALH